MSDTLLPTRVRSQLAALACDALGKLPEGDVPAALKKSASFAPSQRVRLVGKQVVALLEADDGFRARLALQARTIEPGLAVALETQMDVADRDLDRAAALAYLLRTDGWERLLQRAVEHDRRRGRSSSDPAATVERLNAQLARAREDARVQRDRLKSQVDAAKAENSTLRQTLARTRTDLKAARHSAAEALRQVEEVRREVEVAGRERAAEVRRLRARIAEMESDSVATRRVAREDRDAEVVRLRLLLDTMVETANGLRRELALPASAGLPADAVPAVEPGSASAATSAATFTGRELLADDPVLLRRLLELPRVHVIVDGYNVAKEAWPTASLEQQRNRLASGLAGLVSGKAVETTVVFDGADLIHAPVVASPRAVRVRFSPPGIIADEIIRQLVAAEPSGRPVVVVSTDREVAESVTKMGARSVASRALVSLLGR